MGRPADPVVAGAVDGAADPHRRPDRNRAARCVERRGRAHRQHDRGAVQAARRRPRRGAGPSRLPADRRRRARQLPDRPLRGRVAGCRSRPRHPLARRVRLDRAPTRAAGVRDGRRRVPRPLVARRLPVGGAPRPGGAHCRRARIRGHRRLGPVPLGGCRADRPASGRRRPRGRLHVQVPERRSRFPGLHLCERRGAAQASPAGVGVVEPSRHVRHGRGLSCRPMGSLPGSPGRRPCCR